MGQIRQGDVLLVPVDVQPPNDAKMVNEVVLAEGELTGHAHRVQAEAGIIQWEDMFRIRGNEHGLLVHEDHDPKPAHVVVPGQTYRVVIQHEYTLDGMWRKVVD